MRGTGRWRNDSRRPLPVELDAVLARAHQVVEVGGQLAVLDHRRPLRRRALVVDAVAAPLVRAAAVVVGGHERLRELLAQPARVDAGALLDRVGLEPVPDRLVQQHAAEPVADHDRQPARWARRRRRARERLARGRARPPPPDRRSSSSKPACPPRVSVPVSTRPSRRATTWTPSRTRVRSSAAARPSELKTSTLPAALRVADAHLGDLGAGGAGALVAGAQQRPPCARPSTSSGRSAIGWPPARAAALRARGPRPSPRTACATESATRSRSSSARPSTWPK